MKACGQAQAFERLVFGEALADEAEDRHLARGPIDEVLALRGQVHVLHVTALGTDLHGHPWQLPRLADRHEARIELDGDRRAGDEAARLNGRHQVGWVLRPRPRHQVDDLAKDSFVTEQRRDVAEDDALLRIVEYIPY